MPWDGSQTIPVHKVQLKDENDLKILPVEKVPKPFSAKTTCGECHDYKKIGHGWHFSSEGDLEGRASEPWVLLDEKTGTQIPLSLRSSSGLKSPSDLGLTDWSFIMNFGRHMPGGGPGENKRPELGANPRWAVSGDLEINCMACHNGAKCQDPTEWVKQVARENFRWAATAASGLGEISGVAERLPDSWVPSDGYDPDDMVFSAPPSVLYKKSLFDSKHRALLDIGKPSDARCLQCHSVAQVHKEKKEVTGDIHSASGMSCVKCHRNGLDHKIDRGVAGMYSCEGCHEDGTYGAPNPEHKGLPPVHLEKLACTTCHSGSVISDDGKLQVVRTAKINRLGIHGIAQWFTEAPVILEPVFVKGSDGKIAPSRIMWPSFWAKREGDELTPLKAEDVMDIAGEIVDPGSVAANILGALGGVKNADGDTYGQPVYVSGGKVYVRNFDGGLDILDYKGEAPKAGRVFGYIIEKGIESLTLEYDASEEYAFYGLGEADQNHLQAVIEALKPAAPAGAEPAWKLDGILHRLVNVEYELVPKEEADTLIKDAAVTKAAVKVLATKLNVTAEVQGTSQKIFNNVDRKQITPSKKKTPKLYELKLLMRAQSSAEKKVNLLEIFGNKAYRNTFDKDVAKRLLVEPSEVGPSKGSNWGWLKDGVFMPFVSPEAEKLIVDTVGGDEVVFTENQVAIVLGRLGDGHVYVSRGKMFSDDGKGGLKAEEHKDAAPVTWPIAHDVRSASQALGSDKCTDCHSADSDFFFASVIPQGALRTDKVTVGKMSDYMDISGGYHRLFGLTFIVRPLLKLFLLGMAGIAALVALLYALLGLKKVASTFQFPLIDGAAAKIGCLSAIILTITGFCTAACIGRTISGYGLLAHVVFGALYALCLAVLSVMRSDSCKLTSSDEADKYSFAQKICFWVVVVCGIVLVMSMLASMVPIVSSHCQHSLILIHRYAGAATLIAAVVYTVKRKK